MPTVMTHAVVGLGLAEVFEVMTGQSMPPLFWGLSVTLSMLPDLDVLAFPLGIPYGALFGHRGFLHSLLCALLVGLLVTLVTVGQLTAPWWLLWGYFFLAMAAHGILDGFTNGGLGIAFFSPFDTTRYFFPWQPVQVSLIGLSFFNQRGLRVMVSEVVWIWVPLALWVGAVLLYRTYLPA